MSLGVSFVSHYSGLGMTERNCYFLIGFSRK
jgi:hypothetical protein